MARALLLISYVIPSSDCTEASTITDLASSPQADVISLHTNILYTMVTTDSLWSAVPANSFVERKNSF